MSKTIAYYAVHYGKEYLPWSLRALGNLVDEIHILYTPQPSFGHHTHLKNPDTEAELRRAVAIYARAPVVWHTGVWRNESEHRAEILPIARRAGADVVLWVDSDEIWDPATLAGAIERVRERPEHTVRVRFLHFWRSFDWVCEDPCMPVRFIRPNGQGEWYLDRQPVPVLHFGYAQSEALTLYKQEIHGHKAEWKPNWFEQTFKRWTPGMEDVHPTCGRNEHGVPFWTPRQTPLEIREVLDKLLPDHPYKGQAVIR